MFSRKQDPRPDKEQEKAKEKERAEKECFERQKMGSNHMNSRWPAAIA